MYVYLQLSSVESSLFIIKISFNKYSKIKKEHSIKCSRDEIHFVMTISIYKERNTEHYMCV
ncbi:hypothetical protein MLA2C4_13220 [Bacillus mobilis]|nr:hypothetical protein MLA2C4_13220 [Bacillus mobilis]